MSWFSKAIGMDAKTRRVTQDRNQIDQQVGYEENGTGFQDAFNKTAGAYVSNQMPNFLHSMQLTKEDGIRRGISTGDLGTSNEGDLASAFQRNIANALGGLAMQGYEGSRGRIMDLLSGKTGMDINDQNSLYNFYGGLLKGGFQVAAAAAGGGG